eukprot:509740-Prymnesium_polylepis.1
MSEPRERPESVVVLRVETKRESRQARPRVFRHLALWRSFLCRSFSRRCSSRALSFSRWVSSAFSHADDRAGRVEREMSEMSSNAAPSQPGKSVFA